MSVSSFIIVRLNPSKVGMFRFLLEAWDNCAGFSVLNSKVAELKVFFSPDLEKQVKKVLSCIAEEIELEIIYS